MCRFGALPGLIFEKIPNQKRKVARKNAISSYDAIVISRIDSVLESPNILGNLSRTEDTRNLSHAVMLVRPSELDRNEVCQFSTVPFRSIASPYISRLLLERSNRLVGDSMKRNIAILSAFNANSTLGDIFEQFVHGNTQILKDGTCIPLHKSFPSFAVTGNLLKEHFIYCGIKHLSNYIDK